MKICVLDLSGILMGLDITLISLLQATPLILAQGMGVLRFWAAIHFHHLGRQGARQEKGGG